MAFIRIEEQATPATPPSGKGTLFLDSADNRISFIDDLGVVHKFIASVTDVNGLTGSVDIFDILESQEDIDDTLRTTSSNSYSDFVTFNTSVLAGGTYRVDWSMLWNLNTGSRNAFIRCLIDGVEVWEMAVEPKDTGNDIRIPDMAFEILALTAGSKTINLQYRTQDNGDDLEIYRSRIAIQRWR